MLIAVLCEKMGWDYQTYLAQPQWFLDLLFSKYEIDAKEANSPTPKT